MANNPKQSSRPGFHDIPEELAVEIFRQIALSGSRWLYYKTLHTLAKVCVRWWRWIKGTPSLWGVLTDNVAYPLDKLLAKSHGTCTPLDISFLSEERSYSLQLSGASLIDEVAR